MDGIAEASTIGGVVATLLEEGVLHLLGRLQVLWKLIGSHGVPSCPDRGPPCPLVVRLWVVSSSLTAWRIKDLGSALMSVATAFEGPEVSGSLCYPL